MLNTIDKPLIKPIKTVLVFSFVFCSLYSKSQKTDSLINALHQAKTKLEVVTTLNQLGAFYESISDYPKSLYYLKKSKNLNQQDRFVEQAIYTNNYIGYVYWHMSDYDNSLYYHFAALKLAENNNIKDKNLAFTYLMLGNDYYDKGVFNKTSEYYFQSLKLAESIKDTLLLVQIHNRLSKLYFKLKDYSLSIEHSQLALKLNHNNDFREQAVSFNNLGNVSLEKGKTDSALFYFTETYTNFLKSGDIIGQSIACINIGDTYFSLSKKTNFNLLDSSYRYYEKSYNLNTQVENKFGMIYGLWGMADIDLLKLNTNNSMRLYQYALKLADEIGAESEKLNLYYKLHELFDITGKTDSSLAFLKMHLSLKNKIESSDQAKQLMKQESKYEFEKKIAQQKAQTELEKSINKEKNKWKNIIIIIVIVVAAVLTYVTLKSIKQLKLIRSKNEIINSINQQLNEQKQDILDSITYAKRIQNAILPPDRLFKKELPESFIFYLPKDIVAGDFYWMEKKDKKILFAAADCTGHGVPGAMVSVICNNGLNRSVREHGLTDPGKILDKTREIIINEFEKSDEEVKDGMDISLCSLDVKSNTMMWAGANNPLWIVRKNTSSIEPENKSNYEFIELKPNKQYIGKLENPLPFDTQTVTVQKGDNIYLFTDGLKDQFGGKKGKKFKTSNLKELILSIQNKSMNEQFSIIESVFMGWKGDTEQIDDVCLIGIRI